MTRAPSLWLWLALGLAACGDASVGTVEPLPAPERTAAQDGALRALMIDVARHRACDLLRDRFVPLPEDRPGARRRVVEGRLWIDRCRVSREEDRMSLSLSGRGWQWVERSAAGPLGSSFTVRGTVRLEATLDVTSELDLRYEEDAHRVLVAMTPTTPPTATVHPIGTIPIAPDGGWSSIIGGLGGLLGASPEAQARPLLEEQAALVVRQQLARGATLALDLCTAQPDLTFGPIGDGETVEPPPFEVEDGVLWLDNQRVRLHPGGLDLSGPWSTADGDGAFEIEVESGGPVEAWVLCRPEAALLASSYLAGGNASPTAHASRQRVTDRASLALRAADCAEPHVLLTSTDDATVRYRVRRDGWRPEPLVDCNED
ncbi:MAG: hypothetical protein R3B82_23865 [Sandaracinaceae bacterium]